MLLFPNNTNVYELKKSFYRHLSWLIFQLEYLSKSTFNSGHNLEEYINSVQTRKNSTLINIISIYKNTSCIGIKKKRILKLCVHINPIERITCNHHWRRKSCPIGAPTQRKHSRASHDGIWRTTQRRVHYFVTMPMKALACNYSDARERESERATAPLTSQRGQVVGRAARGTR